MSGIYIPEDKGRAMVTSVNTKLPFDENNVNWKPITNADKIRAMTNEELAKFLYHLVDANYIGTSIRWFLKWLLKESV